MRPMAPVSKAVCMIGSPCPPHCSFPSYIYIKKSLLPFPTSFKTCSSCTSPFHSTQQKLCLFLPSPGLFFPLLACALSFSLYFSLLLCVVFMLGHCMEEKERKGKGEHMGASQACIYTCVYGWERDSFVFFLLLRLLMELWS